MSSEWGGVLAESAAGEMASSVRPESAGSVPSRIKRLSRAAGLTRLGATSEEGKETPISSRTPPQGLVMKLEGVFRSSPDELRFAAKSMLVVRWFLWTSTVFLLVYRPQFEVGTYVPYILMSAVFVAVNAAVQYRLLTDRPITWRWLFATNVTDVVLASGVIAVHGGFESYFFLAYFPSLALFAVVFTSLSLCLVWTTIVAVVYVVLSLTVGSGVDPDVLGEKDLVTRIVAMYAVVAIVNLVAGFERIGRREAVRRERALQSERIQLSQAIHDTSAQSAYMIGLGIDNAIELASDDNPELNRTLAATSRLSKTAMWELRQPIDMGLIYEGQPLSGVLGSHAQTFTTITSVPASLVQSGTEPPLEPQARAKILSIAHNALTNAHRHAQASAVTIELEFGPDSMRLAIADDGVGLPQDYRERGHGFRNMQADVEGLGGVFLVESNGPGEGTRVTCHIPYSADRSGGLP